MRTLIARVHTPGDSFKNSSMSAYLTKTFSGSSLLVETLRGYGAEEFDRIILIAGSRGFTTPTVKSFLEEEIYENFGIEPEFFNKGKCCNNPTIIICSCITRLKIKGAVLICDLNYIVNCGTYNKNINQVFVTEAKHLTSIDVSNKNYIRIKDNRIIGNRFNEITAHIACGYYFTDVSIFMQNYKKIYNPYHKISFSKIITSAIKNKIPFEPFIVNSFKDISTLNLIIKYLNAYKIIFVDLEGILIRKILRNRGRTPLTDEPILPSNVKLINKLYDVGTNYIILLSNKPESEETYKFLKEHNIKYHRFIGGMPECRKMLISNYNFQLKNPIASSINHPTNSDTLNWSILHERI